MKGGDLHVSDQELLMTADGEVSAGQTAQVRAHLAACWVCRARMAEIERTIGDFVKVHHRSLDPQLPPIDSARAVLKAQLSDAGQRPPRARWWSLRPILNTQRLAFVCALVLVAALSAKMVHWPRTKVEPGSGLHAELLPDRSLTPGATKRVGVGDICSMDHDEVILPVSGILQERVFQEYGLRNAPVENYEVDYLISPGLGGTDDIRNLWPQPRYNTVWNSFVKDRLEDYLHQSVCSGKVSLATAQHDVATDWISAYKKYFHTEQPVELPSSKNRKFRYFHVAGIASGHGLSS